MLRGDLGGSLARSQSPENGSRLCKKSIIWREFREEVWACRNPLRTGLGSASPGREDDHGLAHAPSQSPENGSRLCKAADGRRQVRPPVPKSQSPENGSRLCKQGGARDGRSRPGASQSQSPENGSRLCKPAAPPQGVRIPGVSASQSPENGSRLCKPKEREEILAIHLRRSQSPENGSRLCKDRSADMPSPRNDTSRNPLRTGLGSASEGDPQGVGQGAIPKSQSPENGSRLCKSLPLVTMLALAVIFVAIP